MENPSSTKKSLRSRLASGAKALGDVVMGGALSDQSASQALEVAMQQVERIPSFDADYVGVEMLLGSSDRPVRTRTQIYTKWQFMIGEGMINTALRQHVQMALGGHETTGETIFIEPKPDAKANELKFVKELISIANTLNKIAHQVCFNAAGFGDAYARIYAQPGKGVVAHDIDSMLSPLVQPYEMLGKTVGYMVSTGPKLQTKMDHLKIVRMKMPRMMMIPQMKVIENAQKINLEAETFEEMLPIPSTAGGSFLDAAEEDFDNLYAAVRGLVGARISGSIDENLIAVNMSDMTKEQGEKYKANVVKMLKAMKDRAEEQVRSGIYSTSRHFHMLPVYNDKQLTQVSSFQGATVSGTATNIDDVMFHAKKLGGTLGIDISNIGFADLLTGGLGDGGLNRTSSQAAERARIIRTAFTQFVNDYIDRHMLAKYGWCWSDEDRPYNVNYFGSIAALEAEQQSTQEKAMNRAAILVQVLAQFKDMGWPKKAVAHLLTKEMQMDQDTAEVYAQAMKDAKPVDPGGGFPGSGAPDIDDIAPGGADDQNQEGQQNE